MKGHMVVSQKIHGRDLNSDINNSRIFVGQRETLPIMALHNLYKILFTVMNLSL